MALDTDGHAVSRRKALKVAVSALCAEQGFGSAEDLVLETLTEALQSYLGEMGKSARAYAELAGRTESLVNDVALALIDIGCNLSSLPEYSRRPNKSVFIPPVTSTYTAPARTLQVGEKRQHPSHIPPNFPPFPDPHTYIKTDALRQPFNEYQVIRERAATQKRDVERALTRFIAKTGETQSLFKDDTKAFPLIAVKPCPLPYLAALLPRDHDLDSLDSQDLYAAMTSGQGLDARLSQSFATFGDMSGLTQGQDSTETDAIDNPYIRPVRMPKKR